MTPAKLWLQVFLAGFIVIVALLVGTLGTGVPYGDLSRIGLISDREFGWRIEPPRVEPEYLQAAPVTAADIVVIGDSFSKTYRWQSVLAKAGLRVTTVFWDEIGDSLCEDFDVWLDRAGFQGSLLIIESIERLLADRLKNMQTCSTMKTPFTAPIEPPSPPAQHIPPFALNWDGKLTAGWMTYWNTRKAKKSAGDSAASSLTRVRRVADGCSMFSHRLCEKALFLRNDEDNGQLTKLNVAQMRSFSAAHGARSILWMVIPNKTTVYVRPDHSEEFVTAFRHSGLGPDLFSFALDQKTKVRDFYFPNDTHLSMHGQLVLGQRMVEAIRMITPPTAPKTY